MAIKHLALIWNVGQYCLQKQERAVEYFGLELIPIAPQFGNHKAMIGITSLILVKWVLSVGCSIVREWGALALRSHFFSISRLTNQSATKPSSPS